MALIETIGEFFGLGRAGRRTAGVQKASAGDRSSATEVMVNEHTALSVSAVYGCVRVRAEAVGSLPLRCYRLSAGQPPESFEKHPLAKLFAGNVNRYQTVNEFLETLDSQELMHGNHYSLIQRLNNDDAESEIIGLLPLMADQMDVRLEKDGEVTYRYTENGNVSVLHHSRIWHTKQFGNGVVGLSTLEFARQAVGLAISAEKQAAKFAKNGFKPAGVLMIDKLLKPEQREAIRSEFSTLVQGDEDPLKVLEAGMTYQQVSISPADAQLLESRKFQLEEICRFFGVPPVMIGDSSGSTVWGSGIQALMAGFYGITLRPRLERLEASINHRLLSIRDRGRYEFRFDAEALLRMDPTARSTRVKEHVQSGLLTPNEARIEMGYGRSSDAAADKLYAQAQLVPLGSARLSVAIPGNTGATQ